MCSIISNTSVKSNAAIAIIIKAKETDVECTLWDQLDLRNPSFDKWDDIDWTWCKPGGEQTLFAKLMNKNQKQLILQAAKNSAFIPSFFNWVRHISADTLQSYKDFIQSLLIDHMSTHPDLKFYLQFILNQRLEEIPSDWKNYIKIYGDPIRLTIRNIRNKVYLEAKGLEIIQSLVDHGAPYHLIGSDQAGLFHYAAASNLPNILEYLLDQYVKDDMKYGLFPVIASAARQSRFSACSCIEPGLPRRYAPHNDGIRHLYADEYIKSKLHGSFKSSFAHINTPAFFVIDVKLFQLHLRLIKPNHQS
jgi:hypothetical protein